MAYEEEGRLIAMVDLALHLGEALYGNVGALGLSLPMSWTRTAD
jgi:hypothetical protein